MNEEQKVMRGYQHLENKEAEKRRIRELLKKSPKGKYIQINERTWVMIKPGETPEQTKERFLTEHKNKFYDTGGITVYQEGDGEGDSEESQEGGIDL